MTDRKLSSLVAAGPATVGVAWVKGCRRGAAVAVAAVLALAVVGSTPAIAAPTPQWSVNTGLMDLQTGRCLDSNAAGNVYTNPCQAPGNTYQDWVKSFWGEPSGQGFFSFRDVATGRCLDSNAAGNLYTLPCQPPGNPYQDWDFSGERFLDHATQRCLDSNAAGNAYTLPCNGGGFQNWKPTTHQSSVNTGLMDLQTARCLDSNAAGNVYTNPCQAPGNTYQDWVETFWGDPSGPGGFFSFRDVATGRCLDSNAAGNLYTLPCQPPGNPYQDWDFSGERFLDHATQRCLDSNYAGNAYTLPCNGGGFQNWNPAAGPGPAPQPPPSVSGSGPAPSTGGGSGPAPATGRHGTERVPGSRVNKRAAAAWALANVNTAPYLFRNDDCTDFVSEALAYGGGDPQTVGQSSVKDWFFFMFRFGIRYSLSWTVAYDLAVHQELIHSYWIRYWRDASPGDLIFADWSGSSFAGISHVGVITGMRNGQPLITQHSPSQRNISLHYWLTHGGRDVHVWIAVPNAG